MINMHTTINVNFTTVYTNIQSPYNVPKQSIIRLFINCQCFLQHLGLNSSLNLDIQCSIQFTNNIPVNWLLTILAPCENIKHMYMYRFCNAIPVISHTCPLTYTSFPDTKYRLVNLSRAPWDLVPNEARDHIEWQVKGEMASEMISSILQILITGNLFWS